MVEKEWSGTKADFEKKAAKLEKAIGHIVTTHREQDQRQTDQNIAAREAQYVETLRKRARKIREWLKDHDDKPGKTGKPKKSNITDNESADMKPSHGVIQGYDGWPRWTRSTGSSCMPRHSARPRSMIS